MTLQSIRRISPEVVKRMNDLEPWMYSEFSEYGLSYQCCRFCGQGGNTHHRPDGLWKYGVRHYVCSPCRDAITSGGKA